MPFRFRLVDPEGTDLGPFVSKRMEWKPGERIGRSNGEDMVITAVIEPEEEGASWHTWSFHRSQPTAHPEPTTPWTGAIPDCTVLGKN